MSRSTRDKSLVLSRHAAPFGVIAAAGNVLVLSGEFDIAGLALWNDICAARPAGDPGVQRVDLTDLEFIDAAGLGAFVELRNALAAEGRRMTLHRPARNIRRAFTVAGLGELMPR